MMLPNQVWPPLSRPDLGTVAGWAYPCAITETQKGPRAWFYAQTGWYPCHGPTKWLVFAAWAAHERKRADAERRLRKAWDEVRGFVGRGAVPIEDESEGRRDRYAKACAEKEAATETLRALGETP